MMKNVIKKAIKKTQRGSRGQSTLEFVLLMPFIAFLVLICFQLGYIIYLNNLMEQSAREGCRAVSTTGSDEHCAEVIFDLCPEALKDSIDIKIYPDSTHRRVGDIVKVDVMIKDIILFNLLRQISNLDPELHASSFMRMECN